MSTPPDWLGGLPDFDVRVDGRPLDRRIASHLFTISVEQNLELPGLVTLELSTDDDWDAPDGWFNADQPFALGSQVDVEVSLSGAAPQRLMSGDVTALEAEFSGWPRLTVRGHDLRHRLQRGRRVRTFSKMKDSDIAAQIGREAGVNVDTTDSEVQHEYLIQANQTDFEFLTERARRIGYELSAAGQRLRFQPAANLSPPGLKLSTVDGSLQEFRVRLGSAGQATEASVRGWDVKQKKVVVAAARPAQVGAMGKKRGAQLVSIAQPQRLALQPVASQAEADKLAHAVMAQSMRGLLQADGLCAGNPKLQAGGVVGIEGVGRRYSGSYYLAEVHHRYAADSGYTTRFSAWRNAL